MTLPEFDRNGNLPPGEHRVGWPEFARRYGYTLRRKELLAKIEAWLRQIAAAGCRTAYIDGSFVCAKPEPRDFDACWDLTGVDRSKIDPRLMDFSRSGRAAMKRAFGGDILPDRASPSGSIQTFVQFFQIDREGRRKGIVRIDLKEFAP